MSPQNFGESFRHFHKSDLWYVTIAVTCFIHIRIAEMASNLHRVKFKKHPPQRWKSRCASASSQEDAATSTSTTALNENRRQEVTTTLAGSRIVNLDLLAAFVNKLTLSLVSKVHSPSLVRSLAMVWQVFSVPSAVAAVG